MVSYQIECALFEDTKFKIIKLVWRVAFEQKSFVGYFRLRC